MKKNFKISIKLKRCETVFKDGLDPGVIGSSEYTFTLTKKEYKSPRFAMALSDYGEELRDDMVEIIYEEVLE